MLYPGNSKKTYDFNILTWFLGIVLILVSSVSFSALDGGVHGGGGNICLTQHTGNVTELADIDLGAIGFPDRAGVQTTGKFASEALDVYGYLGINLLHGNDPNQLFIRDAEAVTALRTRINQLIARAELKSSAPGKIATQSGLFKVLPEIIGFHPFIAFDSRINGTIALSPFGQSKCHGSAEAAIRFSRGFVFLALPHFNSMTLNQQAALLIHEAIRWLQQNMSGAPLTDESVERLTRAIVLADFSDQEAIKAIKNLRPLVDHFASVTKGNNVLDDLYHDVVFEGPLAILNDLMAIAMGEFPGTVDQWAAREGSIDVQSYHERIREILKMTNNFWHKANETVESQIGRLDMYTSWRNRASIDRNAMINHALADYATKQLEHVFTEGTFDLQPVLSSQGQSNTLALLSNARENRKFLSQLMDFGDAAEQIESCTCATQSTQLEPLFEHVLTLDFSGGKRHVIAVNSDNGACFAVIAGAPGVLDEHQLRARLRASTSLNKMHLNMCELKN